MFYLQNFLTDFDEMWYRKSTLIFPREIYVSFSSSNVIVTIREA